MADSQVECAVKPDADESEPMLPKLRFRSITFSDGQTIELSNDDIVVLVGPNNAGKSAALRELVD